MRRDRQLGLVYRKNPDDQRGGPRSGAGRPPLLLPNGRRLHSRVARRPRVTAREPVHVVLRVDRALGRLRRRSAYHAIRLAMQTAAKAGKIRVVHVSIQRHHIHLLVEAANERDLATGMKGLEISAAKRLNAAITLDRRLERRRRGQVFVTRYHAEIIRSPRQARRALAYVLNNWRHHREDLEGVAQRRAPIDPYSSAIAFDGWRDRPANAGLPIGYEPLPVEVPRSWLLTDGWRRHGAVSVHEVPGPPARVSGAT